MAVSESKTGWDGGRGRGRVRGEVGGVWMGAMGKGSDRAYSTGTLLVMMLIIIIIIIIMIIIIIIMS